ncbi:MAG: hypothetical protein QW648_02765 [Nanoarchaeales archaeon]
MVSKELFLVLIVFFLFLFFNLIIEKSSACALCDYLVVIPPGTVIEHSYLDSSCKTRIDAKDFCPGINTGCVIGYYAGKLYSKVYPLVMPILQICSGPESKWYDSPSYNGQICKRRDGWFCDTNIKEGVYDASQNICVICDGKIQREAFTCGYDSSTASQPHPGDGKCESACGASEICDEQPPMSIHPYSFFRYKYYCDGNCEAIECNKQRECNKEYVANLKEHVYCIFSQFKRDWMWEYYSLLKYYREDKNPIEECFDGHDNDCNKKRDCEEPGCAGARNPNNPWDICCQTDDDCPVCFVKDGCPYIDRDGVKGKCSSPQGSGGKDPTTGTYTYKCVWKKCELNSECAKGYCCTDDPNGPKTGEYKCVPKGTIINKDGKSFICDPPDEIIQNNKSNNIIFSLFNYISNLLNQFFFQR